jgi:transcriptional regulator NrdR family protein
MKCPSCLTPKTRVLDCRPVDCSDEDYYRKRRRCCRACGYHFHTYETYEKSEVETVFAVRDALKHIMDGAQLLKDV